jgi:hypothetical protein
MQDWRMLPACQTAELKSWPCTTLVGWSGYWILETSNKTLLSANTRTCLEDDELVIFYCYIRLHHPRWYGIVNLSARHDFEGYPGSTATDHKFTYGSNVHMLELSDASLELRDFTSGISLQTISILGLVC